MFIALKKPCFRSDETNPFKTCMVAGSKGQLKRIMVMRGLDPIKYDIYDAQKVE